MKIESNGVAFNCIIEGPEGAPWRERHPCRTT